MVNGPILLNVTEFLQNLLRGFMEQACVIHEKSSLNAIKSLNDDFCCVKRRSAFKNKKD